jgi:hypothetical protein
MLVLALVFYCDCSSTFSWQLNPIAGEVRQSITEPRIEQRLHSRRFPRTLGASNIGTVSTLQPGSNIRATAAISIARPTVSLYPVWFAPRHVANQVPSVAGHGVEGHD